MTFKVNRETGNGAPSETTFSSPDAHGQAAMLLVESLIHGLITRSVITPADAVEIVEIATEVKEEIAFTLGDSPASLEKSLRLLQAISDSLKPDIKRE